MLSDNKLKYLKEGLLTVVGCAVYAVAVELFLSPLKISPGGLTGVSTALEFISGFPTGIYLMALNLPLIICGFFFFGKGFIAKTASAVVISSMFIEITARFFEAKISDRLLASLCGGVLLGAGLGLVMTAGGSTGGIDIAVKILNVKSNVSIGRAFLLIDSVLIVFSAAVYRDVESALYSVITVFVSSKTVDVLLGGVNDSKAMFIITHKEQEIKQVITEVADRGITVLPAFGGYTGRKNNILLCVARNNEISRVRRLVVQTDPSSFFFVVSAGDVVGKGFK